MSEVDIPVLQAQVIVQGIMLQALARTVGAPDEVREAFAEEFRRLLPTLPADTMSFVTIHADRMLRQLPRRKG